MTEWQILESNNLVDPPAQEPDRCLNWSRWLWLGGGVLAFILISGLITLHVSRTERLAAIKEDIEAAILEEETLRYLGEAEVVSIAVGVPTSWAQAYLTTSAAIPDKVPPGDIEITELEFDGECAIVTVDLVDRVQVRSYCLDQSGWLRTPVPAAAWGQEQIVIRLENGVELHFLPRDQTFAEALAADLPPLFTALEQSGLRLSSDSSVEIRLVPQDLHEPLILEEEGLIILNSPWLTPFQGDSGLAGEAAVRLRLGEALLHRLLPTTLPTESTLPGSTRFITASQTVLAQHLLLTPDMQARLFSHWLAQLKPDWIKPFATELVTGPSPGVDKQADLTARITAEFIYTRIGPEVLLTIIQQLPHTYSWDLLFQANIDRSAVALERDAVAFVQSGQAELEIVFEPDEVLSAADLPLTGAPLRVDKTTADHLRAWMELPNRVEPLLVEVPSKMDVLTTEGSLLPLECAGSGTQLEISGEWLEVPRRLIATRIHVTRLAPLTVDAAPADTMAYLLQGKPGDPQALVALSGTGMLQVLTPLSRTLQVFPLPITTGQPLHFLFRLELPACRGVWFAHYEPAQGITRQWLAPPDLKQWVWRADHQDLIFSSKANGNSTSDIYQTNHTPLPSSVSHSYIPQTLLGWNIERERLVSRVDRADGRHLALFDIGTGRILRRDYYLPLQSPVLSPDGEWLAYLASSINTSWPPNRIELINLIDGSPEGLMVIKVGEAFWPPVWSLNLDQPSVVALAGPADRVNQLPSPTRLMIASPDEPETPQVVAQAAPGEHFVSPVFCADGALLYSSDIDDERRLIRQVPGEEAQSWLMFDQSLRPFACP